MLNTYTVKKAIQNEIQGFLKEYSRYQHLSIGQRDVLIGFADARGDYIQSLRQTAVKTHRLPQEFLPDCTIILSYFFPFTREGDVPLIDQNGNSIIWIKGYQQTEQLLVELNRHMSDVIREWGYQAAVPSQEGTHDNKHLRCNWSQSHIAYAAGLGTFGANGLLITDSGVCGVFHSLVTSLPVEPDKPLLQERCLYKKAKACGLCFNRCPQQSLSRETCHPFDRNSCVERLNAYRKLEGTAACGTCTVALPCSHRNPVRSL